VWTGLESIFQLVHLIMTAFKWEDDALMRAKKLYAQGHDMTVNSLEGALRVTHHPSDLMYHPGR
jgi:hypothetical protein